jgi:hypothetical protein
MAERAVTYGIVSRIVTTVLLLAPVLYAMRRWRLPFGTVTLLFTILSAFMFLLVPERALALMSLTPVVAGLVADAFVRWKNVSIERPGTVYAFGALVPLVLWSANMAALWATQGMAWTPELWSGTIILTALVGVGISLVAAPPRTPRLHGAS